MTICEEVVFSLCDYSKEFVREYKNPKLNQQDIDAIVVDYINYYAAVYYQMDLEMYTEDLRDGRRICRKIKKQDIFETLTFCKEITIIYIDLYFCKLLFTIPFWKEITTVYALSLCHLLLFIIRKQLLWEKIYWVK